MNLPIPFLYSIADTGSGLDFAVKAEIEGRLETVSDTEFLLDLMGLTALAGDSHTSVSVGGGAAVFLSRAAESFGKLIN